MAATFGCQSHPCNSSHFNALIRKIVWKMTTLFSTLVFLLAITAVAHGFVMNMSSTASMVVYATTTVNTYAVCAIVTTASPSVVTACRRRRQYWLDPPPIFFALNDGAADSQLLLSQFLNPSKVHQVEPTVGSFKTNPSAEEEEGDHGQLNYYNRHNLLPGYNLTPSGSVQPSWMTSAAVASAEEKDLSTIKLAAALALVKKLALVGSLLKIQSVNPVASTSRVTVMATTRTVTLAHSGCRPASLPIPACY